MKNLANESARSKLTETPESVIDQDHELYRALVDLELTLFRARIGIMINGDRTEHFHQLIEESGDLYVKIKTILGDHPSSTGSRRCRVRDVVPGRLLSGDPRACGKLDGDRPGRTPARSGVGNDDQPQQQTPCDDAAHHTR